MTASRLATLLVFGGAVLTMASCGAARSAFNMNGPVVRAGSDVPERFQWEGHGAAEASSSCNSPMVDPRDQTRLTLARSGGGHGDYEVPDGRYGVGAGELLRLECGSGRVVGIVRR